MARPHPELFRFLAGDRDIVVDAAFVDSAREHRVIGMVAAVAAELGYADDDLRTQVTFLALQLQSQSRFLRAAAGELHDTLASRGITPVVLKGIGAESLWYDQVGERQIGDLDLFVGNDPSAVREVLGVLDADRPDRETVVKLAASRQLQHLDVPYGDIWVDLHFDPLKLGIWVRRPDVFFDTAVDFAPMDGLKATTLGPECALVSFVTHLNKDRFSYLGAFVDVARVVERAPVDWDVVAHLVSAEGLGVPFWESLRVIVETLELDGVPPAPATGARGRAWRAAWPSSIRLNGTQGRRAHPRRQQLMPLLAAGRGRDNLAELRRRMLPPADLLDVQGVGTSGRPYLYRLSAERAQRVLAARSARRRS